MEIIEDFVEKSYNNNGKHGNRGGLCVEIFNDVFMFFVVFLFLACFIFMFSFFFIFSIVLFFDFKWFSNFSFCKRPI